MATTHFNPPPAKRVKVQSDDSPQPRWLLVPTASRTIQDLLKSFLLRLGLPGTSTYDLYLDGAPILPNEDIALVRDGEQLHLRLRDAPTATPEQSQPSGPHLSATSTPENGELPKKRKRVLTPDGKRRRNARNRRREKRRRLERRKSKDEDETPASANPHDSTQMQDPLQPHETEAQCWQPQSYEKEAETDPTQPKNDQPTDDSLMTGKHTRAVQVTIPSGCPQQKSDETEVPDQATEILPNNTKEPTNSSNSRQEQHLPNKNTLEVVSTIASTPRKDGCPPKTKLPAYSGSNSTARLGAPSQKLNPRLSYVSLQKVCIKPLANNALEKESSGVCKDTDSPGDAQNGSVRIPMEERSNYVRLVDQALLEGTSEVIHELMGSAEKQTVEKVLNEAPLKSSSKPKTNPSGSQRQFVGESAKDANSQGRNIAEIKNAESTRDGAGKDLEIGAAITRADENGSPTRKPMETDERFVDNLASVAAIQVADGKEKQEAAPTQQNCNGDLSDKGGPHRNVNPRWKRRRKQGKEGNCDRPNSRSEPAPGARNEEPIPISQSKDRVQSPNDLLHPVRSKQATNVITTSARINGSEVKSSLCDIIDLVNDDEDEVQSPDNLPVLQSPRAADRSTSASPQTIVVSPAEATTGDLRTMGDAPQAKDVRTACNEVEPVKARSGQAVNEGSGANVLFEGGEARPPGKTGTSRRKHTRSRRLNKPEKKGDNVNSVANASAREISRHENNGGNLEMLKRAVVRDLHSGRLEASVEDRNQTQSLCQTPLPRLPETTKHQGENGIQVPNEEARRDAKKQRKTLRGGLSTMEALRVAKAHAATRLGSPKEMNGTCLENKDTGSPKATEERSDAPVAVESTARSVKVTARKKKKRKRGSGKSRRYLTEEQVNKSIFVGHRPETLLPPPELLELPEGTNELDQSGVIPGVLPDAFCEVRQPLVEPSDDQKDLQPNSHDMLIGNGDENATVQAVAKAANPNGSRSFNSEKPAEEEPSPPSPDRQEESNEISAQAPPTAQEVRDVESEHSADQMPGTGTSDVAYQSPIGSTNVDSFRQDLVHMLQDTTQTLAKVWSTWESWQ